jgi:hypothetical protein
MYVGSSAASVIRRGRGASGTQITCTRSQTSREIASEDRRVIGKRIDDIKKGDIEELITNEVREGRTLDYKLELPGSSRKDKIELLSDVSSFANSRGGDLVYGVSDRRDESEKSTGIPATALGLSGNLDQELLRITSTIRTGLDPTVLSIQHAVIDGFERGPVFVLRIPKSWAGPHIVSFDGHDKFYARDGTGKHALDVHEIRAAFLSSSSLPDQVRAFRAERLARIVAGETPILLPQGQPKVVVHLVPASAFDRGSRVDVRVNAERLRKLEPLSAYGWSHRFDFDGYVTYTAYPRSQAERGHEETAQTYLQTFHTGAMETVACELIVDNGREFGKSIASVDFEKRIIDCVDRCLGALRDIGAQAPVFILVSLLGVSGYSMGVEPSRWFVRERRSIRQADLLLPDVVAEAFDDDPATVLRPALDAVWQATGFPGSIYYDDKTGKWVGK